MLGIAIVSCGIGAFITYRLAKTGKEEPKEVDGPLAGDEEHVVVAIPTGNYKTVHFIRHAEGTHNQASALYGRTEYQNWRWEDARLTEHGKRQCREANEAEKLNHHLKGHQLVLVSPLTRCLETAELVVDKVAGVPWVALECIRERLHGNPCDRRRSINVVAKEFPYVDFSSFEVKPDKLWQEGPRTSDWNVRKLFRESNEELAARGREFLKWLEAREETNVVVVTHSAFLDITFNQVLKCDVAMKRWFNNCEIRSVLLSFPSTNGQPSNGHP